MPRWDGAVLIAAIVFELVSSGHSQGNVTPGFASPSSFTPAFAGGHSVFHTQHFEHRRPFVGPAVLPWFGGPDPVSQPSSPSIIVLQSPSAATVQPEEGPRPLTPMLIERRGDKFVRVDGAEADALDQTHERIVEQRPAKKRTPSKAEKERTSIVPTHELPSTVLVFQDGHREELQRYTITDGVLYAESNYWQTGTYVKAVPLSGLDLLSTIDLNQQRGVRFLLPNSPLEVVTRP